MYKVSTFLSETEFGLAAVPLFGPADAVFEKTASASLLPEVTRYIQTLKPRNDAQYVLVNAMGAGEFFGSNVNGDFFPEAALIHRPDKWTGNPLIDSVTAKDWPYGFPTFYGAHPFAHHKNKDPSRAYGEVELAAWNNKMKRVELVTRIDHDKCVQFGGMGIWDRLKDGQFPDVSMGCFKKGALVTMADGSRKPIEDVRPGDRVLTHKGRPRRVRATQVRPYEGFIYSIKAEAHEPIFCTEEHPFLAVRSVDAKKTNSHGEARWKEELEMEPSWVPASSLTDHVLVEPVVDGVLTPDYATTEFCRLLGYYLAEGHILLNKQGEAVGIQLSTHRDDAVHSEVEALVAAVGTSNPPAWADSSSSALGKYIYIHDRWLAERFLELAGRGAKTKRLAEEVLRWHPDLQAELLGAFMNGDGFNAGRGSLGMSTANRDLAFQFLAILPRLGVVASLQGLVHKAGTGFSRTNTKEWVVHIGKQYIGPFEGRCAKLKREPLLRPKNGRKLYDHKLMTPTRTVTKTWEKTDVYNIDVEEDDSYQVSGLAVHNSKVPYDTCSITLDWKLYREALSTFDPKKHRHPGIAVLEFHKKLKEKHGHGIRGLSITRADYSDYCRDRMNQILPDGRKVFVYNDFPRFFDISYVFIGADRTAKVMVFIHRVGAMEKAASIGHDVESAQEAFFMKVASEKAGELDKKIEPNLPPGKAVPLLTRHEEDLPPEMMSALCSVPLSRGLSTTAGLGLVLRPREFQRIVLSHMGQGKKADELERKGITFSKSEDDIPAGLSASEFMPALARMLLPVMGGRSALGPIIEKRTTILAIVPTPELQKASSLSEDLLRKMGAAYNGYRREVLELVTNAQNFIERTRTAEADLSKLAFASVEEVFTPLAFEYLTNAFMDELPSSDAVKVSSVIGANVQREPPSGNTWK